MGIAEKFFGGANKLAGICCTGLKMQRKPHDKTSWEVKSADIQDLVNLMKDVRALGTSAKYDTLFTATEMIEVAADLLNLRMTPSELQEVQDLFDSKRLKYETLREKDEKELAASGKS